MAWPPASDFVTGVGYLGTIPGTLAWGTDQLWTLSNIVTIINMRDSEIIEEVLIENGNGIVSQQVLLKQGVQIELTALDDRANTYPYAGQKATLYQPLLNGAVAAVDFQVVNNDYNASRKAPGERVLLVKRFKLITPANIANATPT